MKKIALVFAVTSTLFYACGGDETTSDETTAEEQVAAEPEPVVADYMLVAEESNATWDRTLDQKPTKQKVKLFGKMVDVDLGAVKLNTNGTVQINEGGLTLTDDVATSAHVVFDMASFGFAKEKKQGLFDVKEFPNSTLTLNEFGDSTAVGTLTLQGVSKDVDVTTTMTESNGGYELSGSFTINTLDFPLREQVKAKDVNKDEIKVDFVLLYQAAESDSL